MEENDIKEDQKDLLNIIFNRCKLHKLKGKIFRYSGSNAPSSHMRGKSHDMHHMAHLSYERREHYSQTTLEIPSLCSSFINITLLFVRYLLLWSSFQNFLYKFTLLLVHIFLSLMNKIK